MNYAYMLYQAEGPRTRGEQIEDNRRRGELAAALTRLWRRDRKHVTPVPRRGQVTPAA